MVHIHCTCRCRYQYSCINHCCSLLPQDEYEEDFDETAEEEDEQSSQSEEEGEVPTTPANADMAVIPSDSKAVVMKAMDLVEIMQAMDAENQMIEDSTSNVQLVPKSELPGDRSHDQELHGDRFRSGRGLQASPSRKFVDFSSAQRREVSEKVSKKTRKRGQVRQAYLEQGVYTSLVSGGVIYVVSGICQP